ncbi:hypothetical protein Ddc_18854 [Ditylenchus destructor]|nr:hypothetical protein Ddc_18854 [Ditylenchus destructor]
MENNKQYRCCCNSMHVQRGAYIIGIVGTLLSALGLIVSAVTHRWDYVISNSLNILLYASIIYAHKKQKALFYWPFLILNGIGIAFIAIVILILGVLLGVRMTGVEKRNWNGIEKPGQDMEQSNKGTQLGTQYGDVILIAVLSIALFLGVWFQCVVYRAYKYMKMNEMSIPTTHIKTENHKQDS